MSTLVRLGFDNATGTNLPLPEMYDVSCGAISPLTGAGANGTGNGSDQHEHVDEFRFDGDGLEWEFDLNLTEQLGYPCFYFSGFSVVAIGIIMKNSVWRYESSALIRDGSRPIKRSTDLWIIQFR
jgi:hypothetical protein